MNINIIKGDLFTSNDYYVHCISADCALGAGIARQIELRYHVKEKLLKIRYKIQDRFNRHGGFAVITDRIINLVTKAKYSDKPTYESLTQALYSLKEECQKSNITKLSMPAIGCGLDRLDFKRVKNIIADVFGDTDMDITIYLL